MSEKKIIRVEKANASTTNGGVFEGWGTSLCWWAHRMGYSDVLAQKAADVFFSPEGLGLNIMRYNIGGGDDPEHHHITRTDSAVPGWLKKDADGKLVYDYTADHNQLNVMARAVKAAGEDAKVEVFSNSPPYFMTVSGCSSGGVDPAVNNIREDCYQAFGEYLVHVTDYIQHELGIRVTSLSPMNEPDTDFWFANSWKQEGCHVDPGAAQSAVIEAAADALAKSRSTNVILAASDETRPDKQVVEYHAYSPKAKAALGRINTHTYAEEGIHDMGALAKQEGFNLWMSEVDGAELIGENAGEMAPALWFARKMISDINALSPAAWVMWQVVDNHISKEGYNGNKDTGMVDLNAGYWGIAVTDHDEEKIILTQKYYAMGQLTRYIRPGSTIIHCGEDVLAAYNRQARTVTVVAVNAKAAPQTLTVDLSDFSAVGETAKVIRTSGSSENGEHWAEFHGLKVEKAAFTAELLGNAVTTFVIENVEW